MKKIIVDNYNSRFHEEIVRDEVSDLTDDEYDVFFIDRLERTKMDGLFGKNITEINYSKIE